MNVLPEFTTQHDATRAQSDDGLWFKDAVIYQLHVKGFYDSNGDGVGDFLGLTERLDYLKELGVSTLWLQPFYPSPGRDDGYDIADYGDINPAFGTMRDFRRFMQEAKKRDLRVITELVINHTSDQHPWFKRAKRSPAGSSARDWYVWSDTDQKYLDTRIIFTDTEKSNWTWDEEAKAFYWHRFFSHQPDLNFDNPRVISAITQVMKRWLDTGVDGFRLDAVPYLIERDGTNNENLPETHEVIRRLRGELDAYAPGKVLLAEANQWPEDVQQYFGAGDECHMAYHFPLMPRIYMAIAQEDRFPVTDIIRQTPDIPANCQWAMFLRNHDELTLEMVTDAERDYLWSTYAADPRARINLGIRRRLAPLMDNDRRKIELMNSILMSMPGTPIIYYGDEIGMGDNIYLGDRNGVRTPMQWTPDRNGGFSRADPARLYLPPIMDPVYGFAAVNVEAQTRSLASLLSWTKRLIAVRKSSKVFGRGSLTLIRPTNRTVLAYVRQLGDEAILCVANLSRSAQAVELDMSAWKGRVPQEMLGRARFPRIGELPYLVTLPPYGFYWFHLLSTAPDIQERLLPRDVTTLVLGQGWDSLVTGRNLRALEHDVLPGFLSERRWYGEKAAGRVAVSLPIVFPLEHGGNRMVIAVAAAESSAGVSRYQLPLTIRWSRYTHIEKGAAKVIAAVRRTAREGSLVDAAVEPEFIAAMLDKMFAAETVGDDKRRLEFQKTSALKDKPDVKAVAAVGVEQSNTSMVVDNHYVVKLLRKVTAGVHPEVEIGRFFVESAPFAHAPPLLGTVELVENGERSALAVVHGFVENQGDAWTVIGQLLDRLIDEQNRLQVETIDESPETGAVIGRLQHIGVRTADFHAAIASRGDIPAFAPEPITAEDMRAWTEGVRSRAQNVFGLLERTSLPEASRAPAAALSQHRAAILDYIGKGPINVEANKIRHHGDFHLGQVIMVKDDAFLLDFEGEPRRSLEERRRKAPAARDVAGMCRSIDYAVSAALIRADDLSPEEKAKIGARLREWTPKLIEAFWMSYRSALVAEGLWPGSEEKCRELLDFFMLEKAFYEIEYELNNRPDWAAIPLEATLRILREHGVVPSGGQS
ncbi:MAG: maltose alpha-D-glucosyltransferase [Pseudolabrys sp.]|nr:maltose alpha-D-glucosyltransferase [Pseudolabrys sp.]